MPLSRSALWSTTSIASLAILASGYFYLTAQSDNTTAMKKNSQRPPVTVTLAPIVQQDLPRVINANGHVVPLNSVEVRPQVTGIIKSIHFQEGDNIKTGQVLFVLDDAAEQADLSKAKAQLARDQIQLTIAQRNLTRNQTLLAQNFISPSALDTIQADVDTLQGNIAVDQAALASAQVSLAYKTVRASTQGRAGTISVKPGSLVQPSMSTPMVVINQLDPIGVSFNVPETRLAELVTTDTQHQANVVARLNDMVLAKGHLIFVDNNVDTANGTLLLKARFSNHEQKLWPGRYVNIQLTVGVEQAALTVPTAAVLNGPDGSLIYLSDVNPAGENIARAVPISLIKVQDGLAIIKGRRSDKQPILPVLQAGQSVIVEGGINLRPGDRIITNPTTPSGSTHAGKS